MMSANVFAFESDFAGSLRCIPMAVRLKLDLVGIKLSLRQWSHLLRDQRAELLQLGCDTSGERKAYAQRVEEMLIPQQSTIERLEPVDGSAWAARDDVPAVVIDQATEKRVPSPTPAQWQGLSDVQRFALIKLTRPGHENENFVPAMLEFGILG